MTHSNYRETPEQAARAEAGSQRVAAITLVIMAFLEMDFGFYARFFVSSGAARHQNTVDEALTRHAVPIILTILAIQGGILIKLWTSSAPKAER